MDCNVDFQPSPKVLENAFWLLFYDDDLLVKEYEGIFYIPSMHDMSMSHITAADVQYSLCFNGNTYYVANLRSNDIYTGFSPKKLRQLHGHIAEKYLEIAFRAFHVINWLKNNKFCGCCGESMQVVPQSQELAVKCLKCDHTVYPRISPAIIVAVVKEKEILLARSPRFPAGRYSVIAGFVEPGETLESCVRRELREEVGIEVDNIEYFGNQPWPFPDSLMVAFTAQYTKGEITIDHKEIVSAGWFSAATLPDIPDKGSISRRLIDWFIETQCNSGTAKQ